MFERIFTKLRPIKRPAMEIASLLLGLVGLLGWLGITPEMVGDGVYSLLRITIPAIEFVLGAWFMRSILARKHTAEINRLMVRIGQGEGRAQAYSEDMDLLKEENKSLASKIDELEGEKVKPNFSYLSDEEMAMVASAYKDRELFPTPDISMFAYPDITLSQLQKRNIVQKVCVRKVGLAKIDMWQIEPAASEALDGSPGLVNQLHDAYDAAIAKQEREAREAQKELLDSYSCKLSQIDVRSRALLRALVLGRNVYCPSSHWNETSYEYDGLLQDLVSWEYELDSVIQLFPTQLLMDVYRYDPELFERNVDDYLPEREGAPNGWKADGFTPRFDFPWWWEKKKDEKSTQ